MSSVNEFAAAAARMGDTPQPFREILWQRIPKAEVVRQLIFSPAFVAGKFRALASVLCITDRRWLVLLGQNDGRITVDEAVYDTTLLVELTIILLYGQVKIHFVANRETRTAALQFNTVMQRTYSSAIQAILDAIDGKEHAAGATVLRGPLGFGRSSVLHASDTLRVSRDLPIVIEIVDTEEKIKDFLATVEEIVEGDLITLEKVQASVNSGRLLRVPG